MQKMTEYQYVFKICKFLQSEGFKTLTEVPSLGCSMDLLAYKDGLFYAIEVKLYGWRRVLEQCRGHKLVGDYICLAIATKGISETLLSEAESQGYGIIHYNYDTRSCYWALKPTVNKYMWPSQQKEFRKKSLSWSTVGYELDDVNDYEFFRNLSKEAT